jgi:glycine cleavage system aminomethyltransferase T
MSPQDLQEELTAIRRRVGLADDEALACARVVGQGARAFLDRIVPTSLALQDTQVRPTLLLDDEAHVIADLSVARDDDGYLLLAEGLPQASLLAELMRHAPPDNVRISGLFPAVGLLSLHGPWSWELLAEVVGPDVLAMPYLSLLRGEPSVVRVGKTGEYGYQLLVEASARAALRARLMSLGERYGLREVSQRALDVCALENGFFAMRNEGALGLDPIELQQQWRVSYDKQHFAAEALRARRVGNTRRIVSFMAPREVGIQERVVFGEHDLGMVVSAARSSVLDRYVGIALLDRRYAYSGISRYEVSGANGRVPIRTVSTPILNNRSIHVRAQQHSYFSNGDASFPSLV